MPSLLHEALLLLFRNRPELAPELLRDALHVQLPRHGEVRIDSADLTEVQPAEYRADLVVVLRDHAPTLGIIIEVQLAADERQRFPEVVDDVQARADPELAILSAISHGRDADIMKVIQIARSAQRASFHLDADRSRLYRELVIASLSEAARREWQHMKPVESEIESDFEAEFESRLLRQILGRKFYERRAKDRLEARAALVIRQLELRFGPLTDDARANRGGLHGGAGCHWRALALGAQPAGSVGAN